MAEIKGILKVGTVYNISLDDCCVGAYFTSTLTQIEKYCEDGVYLDEVEITESTWQLGTLTFANGVVITHAGGMQFEEVK